VWPALSYHYGLAPEDLMMMPRFLRNLYMRELPRLIARDRLRAAEAAMLPHIEKDVRVEAIEGIKRAAGYTEPVHRLPKEKFAGTLQGIGIGFKRVPKKVKTDS